MTAKADKDSAYRPGPRLNRFYPLADAVAYADSAFLDMVLWVPPCASGEEVPLRLWLKVGADAPEIEIGARRMKARGRSSTDSQWVDFGTLQEPTGTIGRRGFAQLRFYGVPPRAAADAWFVVTPQLDYEPSGSIHEVEHVLCGISRAGVGRTVLSPSRVTVGSAAAFRLRYEVGEGGLPAGAFVRLAFAKAFSEPQVTDADAPGFLRVRGGDAQVRLFSLDTSIESHERIDAVYRLETPLAPGGSLTFTYSTEFTYLFPGRWATAERSYWWSHLPPMSLAVAVDAQHAFVAPLEENGHELRVEAGPPARLHLFLPGRRREGAGVELTGLFTDAFRNAPRRGPLPSDVELVLDGPMTQSLGTASGHFDRWDRFRIPLYGLKPGVHRVRAVDRKSGECVVRSNPLEILASGCDAPCIYWGEIHGHSEQSDGSGDFETMFRHAREDGCLDFAAAADHACYFTDNEWQWMQDIVNAYNEDGRFTTLIGYEWAGEQGHRNVYTSGKRLELFRGMTPGTTRLKVVYDYFQGRKDVVAGPHTAHTRDFYDCHDPDVQRFLEIYSMWGGFEQLAFDVLARGARIGLTGGGDCHEGRCGFSVEVPAAQGEVPHTFAPGLRWKCGMTAAILPRLDRTALLHALREHRVYATTGARILVDFKVNFLPMGAAGRAAPKPVVYASVHACGALEQVDVVRDGQTVHSHESGTALDVQFEWTDTKAKPGEHWYLLRVRQIDRETAWTSPVWLTVG